MRSDLSVLAGRVPRALLLAAVAGLSLVASAAMADPPWNPTEIRGGINVTGVEMPSPTTFLSPYPGLEQYRSLDTLEVELLFTPPDGSLLSYLGNPSIELGGHFSVIGRASMIHLGLNWRAQVFDTPFFVDGVLGGALTNSTLKNATPPDRNVGCPTLIYFGVDAGYQLDKNWSIMGSVYHASHAGLCEMFDPTLDNDGLNGFGVKVGYRF